MNFLVSSFYFFAPQSAEQMSERLAWLQALQHEHLNGLVIVAPDGVNGTVAGPDDLVGRIEAEIRSWPGFEPFKPKHSRSHVRPFHKWKPVLRKQAVTARWGPPETAPETVLSPSQWRELYRRGARVLDVRNRYESAIGTFPGSVLPETQNFEDFARFIDNWDAPRDEPLLTFCTGGIRCERAVPFLRKAGFQQVYQLDGGILSFLEQFPDGEFEGECFVFDERVALDNRLQPTQRYTRCPDTGDAVPK